MGGGDARGGIVFRRTFIRAPLVLVCLRMKAKTRKTVWIILSLMVAASMVIASLTPLFL